MVLENATRILEFVIRVSRKCNPAGSHFLAGSQILVTNNENIGNIINILYINNNHFNLLLPNTKKSECKQTQFQKEISLKDFEKILFKEKKK